MNDQRMQDVQVPCGAFVLTFQAAEAATAKMLRSRKKIKIGEWLHDWLKANQQHQDDLLGHLIEKAIAVDRYICCDELLGNIAINEGELEVVLAAIRYSGVVLNKDLETGVQAVYEEMCARPRSYLPEPQLLVNE